MSQQINLFNPTFRHRKKYFSARTLLQALLLIGIAGLCLAAFLNHQVAELAQLAESGKQQLTARETKLAEVILQYAPRQKSKELALEIAAAAAELTALQDAKGVLQRGEFGNVRGHSAYFGGLARQTVSGLWLTDVTISASGNAIGIEGRTLNGELVPHYIRRLASEPVFQGKTFASLEITQVVEPANRAAAARSANPDQLDAPPVFAFKLQATLENAQDTLGRGVK